MQIAEAAPPFQTFDAVSDDVWRWLHLEGREQCPYLKDYLPELPDPKIQERWVGQSGKQILAEGFRIYALFKELYKQYAGPLTPDSRVLDFGCGFGRVTRFFAKDIAPENMIGIDVNEQAIAACPDRWARYLRCELVPPTDLEPQSFDLIYAYSVFSHLSERVHSQWLDEFKRLLRPGGVLALTTFKRQDMIDRPRPIDRCLTSTEDWLAAYDRGEFCFEAQVGPDYGCTFIPERYARERWPFEVRDYFPAPDLGQNVAVCTKG